jgi:hypothetical protein
VLLVGRNDDQPDNVVDVDIGSNEEDGEGGTIVSTQRKGVITLITLSD